MAQGKITKIVPDRFFFIDKNYWCSVEQYNETPEIGDIVEYTPVTKSNGKKFANNVRFVKKGFSPLDDYFEELSAGYFKDNVSKNLKPDLIIEYPKLLADIFQKNNNMNKSSQIRKYFDSCRLIEGKYKISKDFDYVVTELMKLVPAINNAKEKGHITKDFYNFFEKNVFEAIKSQEHFLKGFLPHFEAIIGFYKH